MQAKNAKNLSGTVTESQISDLGTYLTDFTETDPEFTAWDKDYTDLINTPTTITTEQIDAITTNTAKAGITTAQSDAITANTAKAGITTAQSDAITANTAKKDANIIAGTGVSVTGTYPDITIAQTAANYVGELKDGGIVFYVDHTGAHGLIASLDDLDNGNGVAWSGTSTLIGTTAQSFYDGASNTTAIVGQDATAGYAATLCTAEGTGWYLPANWALNMLYNSAPIISKILNDDGNANTNGIQTSNSAPYGYYWSSTESSNAWAWYYAFRTGGSSGNLKTSIYRVRAVSAF